MNPQIFNPDTDTSNEASPQQLDSNSVQTARPVYQFNPSSGHQLLRRSVLLAVFAVTATLISAGVLISTKISRDNANSATTLIPAQEVNLPPANLPVGPPIELSEQNDSLVVNGDLYVRGIVRFYETGNYFNFQTTGLTANQTYLLPNASGSLCLDSNNCGFATAADLANVQGQLVSIPGLDILVGGIDESEVTGDIEAVSAGAG